MAHKHSVYDNDKHFVIDPAAREIENTSDKVVLMQNDHNSERFTFEIPRYIDGHDMSVCNRVEVHFNNIKADKTDTNKDVYLVTDLQISPDSEDVVICSWLISQNATKYAGTLNFVLRYACIADDGTIDYQWFSGIYRGITVSESIYNIEAVIEEYSDILEQWKAEIDAQLEGVTGATPEQIAAAVENYLEENPISSGATAEQAAQIEQNKQNIQDIQNAGFVTEGYVDEAISNIEIPEGSGAVASVNGKVGAVNLNAEDVGALPATTKIPSVEGLASKEYVDNAIDNISIPNEVMINATDEEVIAAGAKLVLDTEAEVDPDNILVRASDIGNIVSAYVGSVLLWENTANPLKKGDTVTIAGISNYRHILLDFGSYNSIAKLNVNTLRGGVMGCTAAGAPMGYSYYITVNGDTLTVNKIRSTAFTADGADIADATLSISAIYGIPERSII